MDFESVSDELFAARREEFTALRDERARQARSDRELAKRISALRKPTVAAWAVNQASRAEPGDIDRLARLGEELRRAHRDLAGARLRELSRQRHDLVDALTRRAHELARTAGYRLGDDTARQVEDTFQAVAADPRAAKAVREARLSKTPTPDTSEDWLTAAIAPPRQRRCTDDKPAAPKARTGRRTPPQEQSRPAAPAPTQPPPDVRKAREETEEAVRARDEAQRAVTEAERNADAAAAAVAELRGRLAEAVDLERARRAEAAAARKELTAAERALRKAEQRLGRLRSRAQTSR